MTTGDLLLWLSAAALAASFIVYLQSFITGRAPAAAARLLYWVNVIGLTGASGVLLVLLLGHHFNVEYVYAYTSRDLPVGYLLAAFWAGQEGSFLFWALVGGWVGIFVMRKARDLEAPTMMFWALAQGLLLTMLVLDSPFVASTIMPADGYGLNPILQNPWMAIHPPILFLGFVMMTVPAALAAGSLMAGKYERWAVLALPWASGGWLALGAGLILGGLWAYETLGWGGYWGWDPVENSSLVPWITGTVLLHGLIIEKRRNTSQRPNYIYAFLTYLLVLYSTFLTRSGVLGDFSVHSFAASEVAGRLTVLISLMILVIVGLLAWRLRHVAAPSIIEGETGKEVNHYITSWVLTAIAFLILLGTSAPILTGIINPERPSGVQQHFYNSTTGPFALVMLALLALSPLMAWTPRGSAAKDRPVVRWIGLAAIVAVLVVMVLLMQLGVARGTLWALGVFGVTAAAVNSYFFVKHAATQGLLSAGFYLAHLGIGLMFVGIAASNLGGEPKAVSLVAGGEADSALGWKVQLEDVQMDERGHMVADLRLTPPGEPPRIAAMTGKPAPDGSWVFTPYIHRSLSGDIYFAPREILPASTGDPHEGHDHDVRPEVKPLENSTRLEPVMIVGAGGSRGVPMELPGGELSVSLNSMSVETGEVHLGVTTGGQEKSITLARGDVERVGGFDIQFESYGSMSQTEAGEMSASAILNVAPATGAAPTQSEMIMPEEDPHAHDEEETQAQPSPASAILEVSRKPLMSVLWLGCVLAGMGSLLAVTRRFREMKAD